MKFLFIVGPTASGKSDLALDIARRKGGHIINADAIQVFKDIPIITAQPSQEEQQQVPHSLYGFLAADAEFSVQNWLDLALPAIEKQGDELPILVGGTGLYCKMLTQGFKDLPALTLQMRDEIEAEILEIGLNEVWKKLCAADPAYERSLRESDKHRIIRAYGLYKYFSLASDDIAKTPNRKFFAEEDYKIIYVKPDREELYERANQRVIKMLDLGAIDEVKKVKEHYGREVALKKSIGYCEIADYLDGNSDYQEMISRMQQHTRNFIKRQFTWFNHQLEEHIALKKPDVNEVLKFL